MQKKIKLRPGQVVEVIWVDTIFFMEASEEELEEAEQNGGVLVHTLGYLSKITPKAVTIFSEKFEDGEGKGSQTVIPFQMVQEIRLYVDSKPRKVR